MEEIMAVSGSEPLEAISFFYLYICICMHLYVGCHLVFVGCHAIGNGGYSFKEDFNVEFELSIAESKHLFSIDSFPN